MEDSQTWGHYLSEILKVDVLNFGVPRYGLDQSYLKFKFRTVPKETKIVALGFIIENASRNLNVYRKFYVLNRDFYLAKPRFIVENGKLKLLENPIRNIEEIERVKDPAFISKMGENDFWFSNLPTLTSPRSLVLFDKDVWKQTRLYLPRGVQYTGRYHSVWDLPETKEIFLGILDAFVQEAKDRKLEPVIFFFPEQYLVKMQLDGGSHYGYSMVLEHCKTRRYKCFNGIEALAKHSKVTSDIEKYYIPNDGHLSPIGNRTLAEDMVDFLMKNSLVEPAKAP